MYWYKSLQKQSSQSAIIITKATDEVTPSLSTKTTSPPIYNYTDPKLSNHIISHYTHAGTHLHNQLKTIQTGQVIQREHYDINNTYNNEK